MEKFRKLTPHDLAFGIGRKATKEELEEEIKKFIAQSKITGKVAIGLTMKHLKEKFGATFDGKKANEIINKLLGL